MKVVGKLRAGGWGEAVGLMVNKGRGKQGRW